MNLFVWCWVFLKWQYQTKCTTLAFQLPHRNIPLTFESEKCLNYIKFNNGKVHGKTLNSKSTKLDTLASSCIKFYPNIFSTNRTVKKSIDLQFYENKHDMVAGGSVHTNTFAGKGYNLGKGWNHGMKLFSMVFLHYSYLL